MRKYLILLLTALCTVFISVAYANIGTNVPEISIENMEQKEKIFTIKDAKVDIRLDKNVRYLEGYQEVEWPWDLPDHGWSDNPEIFSQCSALPEIEDKTFWYHIIVDNKSVDNRFLVLTINNIFIKYLSVYVIGPNGALSKVSHTGLSTQGLRKLFPTAAYSFPINFVEHDGGRTELYIKVTSDQDYRLDMMLQDLRSFSHRDAKEKIVNAVITGFMLLVSLFSLVMFIILREKRYLSYVVFASSLMADLLITGSYSSLFLPSVNSWPVVSIFKCFCFITLWGIQLISFEYLAYAKWRFLKYVSRTFSLFLMFCIVLVWIIPNYFSSVLFFFGAAVMFLLTLVWAIYAVTKRNIAHFIYAMAQLTFIFGCIFPFICTYTMWGWSKYAIYDFFLISISASIMISASLIYRFYKENNYNRSVTQKIKTSRRQFVDFFSMTSEGMFRADVDGKILNINPALCKILGYANITEITALGLGNIKNLCCDEDNQKLYGSSIAKLMNLVEEQNEDELSDNSIDNIRICLKGSDGRPVYVSMTLKLADKNGGSYTIIGDVRDLSGDEDLRRRLRYMEFYDQNTGAYNRKYMMTLLENIFHHESEYMEHSSEHFEDVGGKDYLCFIHVNNLKYIRDTVGHEHADLMLKMISDYLTKHLPEKSSLICLNNDEFAVVMRSVYTVLNQVKTWINGIADIRYSTNGYIYNVTTDCGIVDMSIADNDVSVLLSYADIACRNASSQGPNQCFLCCERTDRIMMSRNSVQTATSVWNALNSNSIRTSKNILVSCSSDSDGTMASFSVLIRNNHGDFIDTESFRESTEDFNLMPMVDMRLAEYMVAEVNRRAEEILADYKKIIFCIHSETLCDNYLVDKLYKQLSLCPQLCERLVFLFDTYKLDNRMAQLERFISRFENTGICFGLKDFIGNRVSLEILEKLPVKYVQLDPFYTKELFGNGKAGRKIAEATVDMLHDLKIEAIAVNVGSETEYRSVTGVGFDWCQGEYAKSKSGDKQ